MISLKNITLGAVVAAGLFALFSHAITNSTLGDEVTQWTNDTLAEVR